MRCSTKDPVDVLPEIVVAIAKIFPPTYTFPPIPAPPVTWRAPDAVLVEIFVCLIFIGPSVTTPSPTYNVFCIFIPPIVLYVPSENTFNDSTVSVVFVTTVVDAVNELPINTRFPINVVVPNILTSRLIPTPPSTTKAPVAALPLFVVPPIYILSPTPIPP